MLFAVAPGAAAAGPPCAPPAVSASFNARTRRDAPTATSPQRARPRALATTARAAMQNFLVPSFEPRTLEELPTEPDEVSMLVYLEDAISKEVGASSGSPPPSTRPPPLTRRTRRS